MAPQRYTFWGEIAHMFRPASARAGSPKPLSAPKGSLSGELQRAWARFWGARWFVKAPVFAALWIVLALVLVAAFSGGKATPTGPYLSEEAVASYSRTFIPTPAGRLFCARLYGKNTPTQIAIAMGQAALISTGTTGKRASDSTIYATFQTYCDMAY
jgi:hypothetical protein